MPVAPPLPRSLSLNALRAFEAAARLQSFVAAAEELGVTAGAVAAHIKALEADLGARLFDRRKRGIELTTIAQRVLPEFIAAFDGLAAAAQSLQMAAAPQRVHIAALPAIAQLWLSPRLPKLRAAASDITVSITALEAPPNMKRVPFDLSLFYRPPGEGSKMDDDVIFPVCAPAIAKRLKTLSDLNGVSCLIDATWSADWDAWSRDAAPGVRIVPNGPVFSLYALALAEAVNGAGVLMGHEALVRAELDSGRLVAPFAQKLSLPRDLSVTSASKPKRGSAAQRVVELLQAQAP